MKNFFNAIGVADMERVHSAVIGWMLSDGCEAFDLKVKSRLLCKLFGVKPSRFFSKITVNVEIFNIDILVETEDESQTRECWIIENKIKSNQYNNQLDKYVQIIAGEKTGKGTKAKLITEKYKDIPEEHRHFCFLTLIDEKAKGDYSKLWKYLKYSDLVRIISKTLETSKSYHEHGIILREYVECIKELDGALSDFLNNPKNYSLVFTDGSKRKDEKDADYLKSIETTSGKLGRFISECGLETIFQKCYLGKRWNEHLENTKKECKWDISETRGYAALDIHYPMIKNKSTQEEYYTQIEFQNGTFKVQVCQDKDVNKTNQRDNFQNKWKDIFKQFKRNYPCWTVNCPKKNSAGLYLSISKHIEKWWTKEPAELWNVLGICEDIRMQLIAKGNCEEVNS